MARPKGSYRLYLGLSLILGISRYPVIAKPIAIGGQRADVMVHFPLASTLRPLSATEIKVVVPGHVIANVNTKFASAYSESFHKDGRYIEFVEGRSIGGTYEIRADTVIVHRDRGGPDVPYRFFYGRDGDLYVLRNPKGPRAEHISISAEPGSIP